MLYSIPAVQMQHNCNKKHPLVTLHHPLFLLVVCRSYVCAPLHFTKLWPCPALQLLHKICSL